MRYKTNEELTNRLLFIIDQSNENTRSDVQAAVEMFVRSSCMTYHNMHAEGTLDSSCAECVADIPV